MGKQKLVNILEMANYRMKRSEIWDSGGTSGTCMGYLERSKVTCGSFGALPIFRKYDFQNGSTLMILFTTKRLYACHMTVHIKVSSLNFGI